MTAALPTTTTGRPLLQEVQRLPSSGARAVAPFSVEGGLYLAVPQLATDIPGQPTSMTGGNHDVDTLIYRWQQGVFVEHQRLPVCGGEDAEFFTLGERAFLATASLRRGSGPYSMDVSSVIWEWRAGRFEPFQRFATFAAKQWHHFAWQGRHFLALAQGVTLGEPPTDRSAKSAVFEWNGERFVHLQDVTSAWGYNWRFMAIAGRPLLAYADHAEASMLLAFDGRRFEPFQVLEGHGGRAFCHFQAAGCDWLAFATLHGDSQLYRWSGERFELHQRLSGPGGREFEWIADGRDGGWLVQVNFIHGTREAPLPVLPSFVYAWRGDGFERVEEFPTSGGTDAAAFTADGVLHLAVSNSLTASQSFRTDTLIYRFAAR